MDENLMCPICGGLHPAGHRDKELEDKLEAVKVWFSDHILSVWNLIPPEGLIVHKRGLEKLRKILEAEG